MELALRDDKLYASLPMTYINRVYISFMEGVHMIREKSIGEQGKKDEFRKGEKFLPR